MNLQSSVDITHEQIILDEMKKIHYSLLNFLDNDEDIEENFKIIQDIFEEEKITEHTNEFKLILVLIVKISNNHHRNINFFAKIDKLLLHFKENITQSFTNSNIFDIFKSNKRIILFLVENKILIFDEYVCKQIITERFIKANYPQFFYPELKPYSDQEWFPHSGMLDDWIQKNGNELPDSFYESRKIGENDSDICVLIQKNNVKEFQSYIISNDIPINLKINSSIFETNFFLIKASNLGKLTLINYVAFFGSFQIFKFLQKKGALMTPELWLYAIHGNNQEIIHFLEDNRIIPEDKSFQQTLIESIRCHHNVISSYLQKKYFDKGISKDVLIEIFKYHNFSMISEKDIGNLKICDFVDHDEILDDISSVKKRRGRPPGRKIIDKACKKQEKKKRVDNNEMMMQLKNPQLVSIPKKTFLISVPPVKRLQQDVINSLQKDVEEKKIDWNSFDIEGKFECNKVTTDSSKSDNDSSDNDASDNDASGNDDVEENESEDTNDVVNKDNLEDFAPFQDELNAETYLFRANKGYRLTQIETNDPNIIAFKCSSQRCYYRAEFVRCADGFHINKQTHHTCSKHVIISTKQLKDVIYKYGKTSELNKEYMNKINASFGLLPNTINKVRIRRLYNIVFQISNNDRLASWGKLNELVNVIKKAGGNGCVHKDKQGFIDFVGIIPNYAIQFIWSSVFFPVVQCDTRFQIGISKGNLYSIVALTGNRSIIPLGFAWAQSEKSDFTDMLLALLRNELNRIKSCHTDDASELFRSFEKVGITSLLCSYHISKHLKSKKSIKEFMSLVKSQTSYEYQTKKKSIIENENELSDYLNKRNRWSKISRFENEAPRDQNISSTAVESFNATIAKLKLKNKEPFEIFQHIYDIGYFALKDLCFQKGILTECAREYLSYALAVAQHLAVHQTPISQFKYEVVKDNDLNSKCTVIICPAEVPICLCKFYHDTGMVCIHLLAVASKFNYNWTSWVHPRFFISNYQTVFHNIEYPNFDGIIQTNNDIPVDITSLVQRKNRIDAYGHVVQSHKH